MKYIDAEKLIEILEEIKQAEYENCGGVNAKTGALYEVQNLIESLQQEQIDMGEVSDGYHTFNELYYYRMLYNAAFFNLLPKAWVHKSKRHNTGEECFGGGWFIVMANLPTGQVSNHYELKDWDLFKVPEKEIADEWDGHTPQEAAKRIYEYLKQEQLDNNGWIDCRKQMPKETKQWSDTLQGHREWTESDLVLAWDSMYGCRVDATKNGKWMSEQRGGYTGQICHGIIAWRPIPEFNEELLF